MWPLTFAYKYIHTLICVCKHQSLQAQLWSYNYIQTTTFSVLHSLSSLIVQAIYFYYLSLDLWQCRKKHVDWFQVLFFLFFFSFFGILKINAWTQIYFYCLEQLKRKNSNSILLFYFILFWYVSKFMSQRKKENTKKNSYDIFWVREKWNTVNFDIWFSFSCLSCFGINIINIHTKYIQYQYLALEMWFSLEKEKKN